ncbi:hypothetical protein A2U01_0102513, partial [Trifolium medium]|nr:hypothetical protein [Trifolium medium]
MVSFLFAVRKEQQQNNNPSFSSVLTDDDVHDDRVCLHVSVGDPCCPSCNHQQQLTTNNKRK